MTVALKPREYGVNRLLLVPGIVINASRTRPKATLLHLLGIDHTRLTYRFQGRYFRLTDVHGNVVTPLLA
jgi:hypothetical protein